MRRHIHCQVAGAHARSDSHFAGVRGSANAMQIIAEFGRPWQLCTSITATFYDANGENPDVIPLVGGESEYANRMSELQYLFAVPQSAAAVAGKIRLVFDGYIPDGVMETEEDFSDVVMLEESEDALESDEDEGGALVTGPVRLRAVEEYEITDAPETVAEEWGALQPTEVEKLVERLGRVVGNAVAVLALHDNPPKIVDGYWYLYNPKRERYERSGKAQGEKGDPGEASGALVKSSVGTAHLKDGAVTLSKLSDSLRRTAGGLYCQVNYRVGRQNVKKDNQYRLWFDDSGVLSNDVEREWFAIVKDTDGFPWIQARKAMCVRISGQVALVLGSANTAAAGGMRSLHIWKADAGGQETQLVRATVQDWSKTHGRFYTVSAPPRIVELNAGDRLKLVAYMKKNDSLSADYTWMLAEVVGTGS